MAKSRARKLADIIVSAGVDIDGNLTFDGGSTSADLTFADNDKANFGDASDLQIYHDGSNSWIKDTGTGSLLLTGSTGVFIRGANNENSIQALEDGAVKLYYDNSEKLATSSSGVSVTGHVSLGDSNILKLGTASDLQLYHDGSNSSIQNSTGNLYLYGGGGTIYLKAVNSEDSIVISPNAGVSLYYDNSAKFATTSAGIDVTGSIDVTSSASYGVTANRGFKSTADIPNFTLVESDASGQTWQINSTGAKLSFRDISRQLDRIVIDTAGRVGVGTTSPAGLLEISADSDDGTAAPSFLITNASTTLNDGAVVGTIEFRNSDSSGTGPHVAKIQGIANASDERTTEIAFSTGSVATTTEQMRIDSSGNVGIGTNSPSIQVDVENTVANSGGKLRLGTSDSSTSGVMGRLIFGNGNDIAQSIIEGISDGATDASALIFKTEATGSSEAERMRIDSSGNLLVGKTSLNDNLAGFQTSPSGETRITRSGGLTLVLNRKTSDGEILGFRKDGTVVGSIANDSTSLVVTSASTGLKFGSAAIWPTTGGGVTNSNGAKDLGASTAKFKDAYFTGTVHAQGGVEVLGTSTMIKHDYNNLGSYVQEIRADDRRLTLSTKTNDSNAGIVFELYDAEKARFDYAGRLLIGQNSNTGSANADNLVVGTGSGNNGITILSGTTNGGTIAFADADADEDGFIAYNHPSQFMQFGTAAAEQMRITSAGRVGINESSPDALLHITGQSTAGLIVENGAGNASTQPYVSMAANNYSSGYGTFRWEDQRASQASPSFIWEVHDGSGSVLAYDFRTGATGAAGSKLAITQDGKVGIGTTSPYFPLHVQGANSVNGAASTTALFFDTSSAAAGTGGGIALGGYTNGTGGDLYHFGNIQGIKENSTAGNYDSAMIFSTRINGTAPQEKLRITSTGRVGIGTSSPFAKLQVAGSELFMHGGSTTTGPGIFLGDNNFANSNYYNSAPGIGAVGPYGGVTAGLAFYVYGSQANSRNEAMRIDNTGKVGVGTAVPNRSDFNIHGANRTLASTTSQVAITASDSIAANIGGSLHFGARYDTTTTDFAPTGYVAGRRENATVNNYAGYLQFGVTQGNAGTIEAMRINSSGNVGIGTTVPGTLHSSGYGTTKLHVDGGTDRGQIILEGDNNANFIMSDNGATANSRVFLTQVTDGLLKFRSLNDNGTSKSDIMSLTSAGKVGIGTTSPASTLHVRTGTNTQANIRVDSNGTNAAVFFANPSGNYGLWGFNNARLSLATSSTERMSIDENGNVGIGTTSPTSYANSQTTLVIEDSGSPAIAWSDTGQTRDWFAVAQGSGLYFNYADGGGSGSATNVSEVLVLDNSGNVGIGTASPSAKLEVRSAGSEAGGAEIRLQHANNNTNDVIGTVNFANNVGSAAMIQGGTSGANNSGYISFHTDNAGSSSEKMRIHSDGTITPGANGTQDFGSNSMRWANIYTGDLHLSNEEKGGNDVDGTTGNWTVQEGEENLYLINNKTGKKYKFTLEEIE